jgi:hypothetical protein
MFLLAFEKYFLFHLRNFPFAVMQWRYVMAREWVCFSDFLVGVGSSQIGLTRALMIILCINVDRTESGFSCRADVGYIILLHSLALL